MIRTQIQLTEAQHKNLKRWARRSGISLSEAVRRCVDETLHRVRLDTPREQLVREAMAVVGKYSDPEAPPDVAREHDSYLAEAFRR